MTMASQPPLPSPILSTSHSRYGRHRIPTERSQPTHSTAISIIKRSTKGRKPKAAVLLPTASALAIVEGEAIKEALNEAVTTMKPVKVVNEIQIQKPQRGTQATITVSKTVRSEEFKEEEGR